ncbi:DMT family transporter [Clostridium tertium]|jgi:drug/metabolite transporter (DMT)-like permease|uniref:DMT family transporter n=3 Tax=Clostridium TaxID=1485 RepID=UPI002A8081C3|nr:DMT family transporter [Clostridium tertium]MBS6500198.1 EamA family transporter [Clostridium sp.]MDY4603645.1 DMT family transporter [Clostridium tertium]
MKIKGILFTILSAIIFGFTPALANITYEFGNNSLSMTFFRNLLAIPILFFILKYKRISLKVEKKELKHIFILSLIGVALTTALLYSSYSYIGVGVATTLHFMYPIFVALACRFIFNETLGKRKVLSLVMAFLGVALFMDMKSSNNLLGALMALISGLTYAFYIVYLEKKELVKINPYKLSFYIVSFVSFEMLIGNIFGGYIKFNLSLKIYILMIIISLLTSIVGVILFQVGVSIIGSTSASIFSLFEPITSVISGLLLFNESIDIKKIIGCLVIFIAVTYLAIESRSNEKHDNEINDKSLEV